MLQRTMLAVRRQQQNRRGGWGGGGGVTSGHYRCRYHCGQNHVGALQVSLSGHHRCHYHCGQNHVRTLQVSLSMWAESRRGTTGVTVRTPQVSLSNVGRITSGHYRCHCRDTTGVAIKCGQNHVRTLQVSLSV